MKSTAKFIEADQNWQAESTTYWFQLDGHEYGTDYNFESNVYGVIESGTESQIVFEDGSSLTQGDIEYTAVENTIGPMQEYRELA